ncbi:diguanylate cyclase [Exiguobacterium sibiricum 255-15]|uniref:Diguanylate cyclase n=1 Tax=Exiguobacterium sibiricum (strain DSM 17290 / CCUG 55495 / CIP 109462 / JCM 13490 / 255-15) TaxID=262543 RepID=B1YKK6_EXIS2|nr:diguanylate cyclase [Exiguobacterium sibiricum]ACB60189.1 diguanylate cyclase [Exiguobacterium sibiricum 255-15]
MKKFSIRFDALLALLIAGLFFVMTLSLTFLISNRATDRLKDEVGTTLSATAYQLSDKLDHYMWSRTAEVNVLRTLPTIRDGKNPAETRNTLEQLQQQIPDFSWIGVMNPDGQVIASTGKILEGQSIKARPVFQEAQKKPFIGDVHDAVLLAKLLPNPSGEPLQFVDISTPLFTNGKMTGVLATHLSFEWAKEIEQSFQSSTAQIKDVEFLIVSKQNRTVLLGPKQWRGKNLPSDWLAGNQKGYRISNWENDQEYLIGVAESKGYKNYNGLGWTVLVRQPSQIAFSDASTLRNYILIAGLIASLLTAIIGWFVARLLTRPLKKITLAAEAMQHDRSKSIPAHTGIREIEVLSVALRELTTKLTHTEQERTTYESLALHDALTGLPNRNGLSEYLDGLSRKTHDQIYLYLDLDGFKAVNDQYGHAMGDLLLIEVADRLQKSLRYEGLVARLGGDEFLIILNEPITTEEIDRYGRDIIHTLSYPYLLNQQTILIGASIGVAIRSAEESIEQVIHRADIALYDSKHQGKGCLTFHY